MDKGFFKYIQIGWETKLTLSKVLIQVISKLDYKNSFFD